MSAMLIFGLGYTATRLAERLRGEGWRVTGTRRAADGDAIAFEEAGEAIATATHILSSVPPEGEADPVLAHYGDALRGAPARWIGYLSSTGVYGDAGGAWVDESAAVGSGRRSARVAADLAWQALGARVFRLPGIYGPGRSALDRVAEGKAHRVELPGQVFSRVHVDDIVGGVIAGLDGPAGVYNLADDLPCGQNAVVEYAAALLGLPLPPFVPLDSLSAMARGFYAENRMVSNGKAKRVLGWAPAYPDYRAGLRSLNSAAGGCITRGGDETARERSAITSPTSDNAAPAAACHDQT